MERAAGAAAPWLREPVDGGGLDKQVREMHLHLGQPPLLAADGEEYFPSCRRVGLRGASSYAVNTACRFRLRRMSIAQGYLTARGGHRLGLCGTAIVREGKMTGMKELRSVCIRVARDLPGLAAGLPDRLGTGSALILGPPGAGKTTLLRDLIRRILRWQRGGSGRCGPAGGAVSAALYQGYQFQTGSRTDVLTGASKAEGMELLLRSMGPKWIAVDEITALEDCAAMEQCSYCGVRFLATAHAWSVEVFAPPPGIPAAAANRNVSNGCGAAAGPDLYGRGVAYRMIQWIGAICVVGACGACGFSMAASYTGLQRCLQQLQNGLELMQCQMEYQMTELPELCAILASACTGPVGKFFGTLGQELAAGRCVGGADLRGPDPGRDRELPEACRSLLSQLGKSLGQLDLAGQLRGLAAAQEAAGRSWSGWRRRRRGGFAATGLWDSAPGPPWPSSFCKPMEVDLIFKIAAVGIIVTILNQVLVRSGREEQATMTTLAGLVVVLMILAQRIAALFDLVKTLFQF